MSCKQILLKGLDLPVNLKVQKEEKNKGKKDQDYQVHPKNVDLGQIQKDLITNL